MTEQEAKARITAEFTVWAEGHSRGKSQALVFFTYLTTYKPELLKFTAEPKYELIKSWIEHA